MTSDIERDLRELGERLDAPAAPHLAARVANLIEAGELGPGPARRRRRPAVALAVVAAAGLVAVGPVVADWLGVGGVEVRQEPAPPAITAALGDGLDLGARVSRATAAARFGRRLLAVGALGEPDEIWLDTSPAAPVVTLVFEPRPALPATDSGVGALLSQVDASIAEKRLWTKFADGATVTDVVLGDGPALWVEGSHYVALRDRAGNIIPERVRLAANVLLWEQDGLTVRLETALGRDAALAMARTVR